MKATLIKKLDNGWPVYSLRRADGKMIATTRFPFDEPALMIAKNAGIELQKLSRVNCDEIFGVINAQKLAIEHSESELSIYPETSSTLTESEVLRLRSLIQAHSYRGFEKGFNKAMELNKDKQFTLEDMHEAIRKARSYDEIPNHEGIIVRFNYSKDEIIDSIKQPTEIEVEVEMDYCYYPANLPKEGEQRPPMRPKLDSEGCLILKKTNVSS